MDVGVRELKQRLSRYLERVARGETVRVTDRGVPKAMLAPVPGTARLEEGIRRGWSALPFLTYDVRQAQAARSLGWTVLGR